MNTDVLIFGCTGQDGSYLSKSLINKGLSVLGVSRSEKPNVDNLHELSIADKIQIIQGDITIFKDVKKIIAKHKPKIIYNLSAQSSVGISLKKPYLTSKSIVDATINLLEACRISDFQGTIFFAGSSEIYGETKEAATIQSRIDIRNPYALAKYQSYLQVKAYREIYNLKSVTGILFNHESPLRNKNFVTQKIINGAIECMQDKSKALKLGNLNIVRDWGCAEEYTEGIQAIANATHLKDQIICSGKGKSIKDLVTIVFNNLNMNWEEHVISDQTLFRENEANISIGNPNLLEKDLEWKAKIEIENVLDRMIQHSLKKSMLN